MFSFRLMEQVVAPSWLGRLGSSLVPPVQHAQHSLMVKLVHSSALTPWWLTAVYGPQSDADKVAFLQHLFSVRSDRFEPLLLCSDFKLIYKASDKNNSHINHRPMGVFQRLLQDLDLAERHLNDRLYTWSNELLHPTLTRIDHAFACSSWLDLDPHHRLREISSACSNHAPLLLHSNADSPFFKRFKFEAVWPRFPGFLDAVQEVWHLTIQNADDCRTLDFKLCNTPKAVKRWSQQFVGSIRIQLAVARQVIFKA
jgi:hypothetical protein